MSTKIVTPPDINRILTKAKSVQTGLDIYSNVQRVIGSPNEIIIDFYSVMPDLSKLEAPQATHLQRIILPLATAVDLSNIIATTIANIAAIPGLTEPEDSADNHSED